MTKPLFLVDLDDNLFQTQRKMTLKGQTPAETAALDRALKPRSFFSQEQANFVHWLLEHADVIPVTARGTEETARVTIPFSSWKVMTHGAVITMPDDQPDPQWQDQIQTALIPYQQHLHDRQAALTAAFKAANIDAWARINFEYDGQAIYLVAKHTDSSKIDELYAVADQSTVNWAPTAFTFTVTTTTSPGCRTALKKAKPPVTSSTNCVPTSRTNPLSD